MVAAQPKASPVFMISHPQHDVEGRNRSALSYRVLKEHLQEFKFQRKESYSSDAGSTEEDTKSSATSSSDSSSAEICQPHKSIPAASAVQVRSKFFNKLGISPPVPEGENQREANPATRTAPSLEEAFQIPLNDLENGKKAQLRRPFSFFGQASSVSSTTSDDTKSTSTEEDENPQEVGKKGLRFNPSVTVHSIPIHTVYSKRIRETIWTSATEMEENVARNCLEFAAENWDWQQVLEDPDMVVYHGELVHPVHFEA